MLNNLSRRTRRNFEDMSQLFRLEGKHTTQNARCAVWIGLCVLALVCGGYILGEYIFGWTKKRHVPVRRDRKKRQESQVRSKSWRGVSNWQQPAGASFWNICNDFHPTPQNTILFDRESMTFNNSYQIIILSASASVPIHAVFLQNFPIWCDSFLPLELHSCQVCNHT